MAITLLDPWGWPQEGKEVGLFPWRAPVFGFLPPSLVTRAHHPHPSGPSCRLIFFPFSLESFITALRIYYRASLSCDLGFGGFPPFGTNALIWVWFAGGDGAGIIIF